MLNLHKSIFFIGLLMVASLMIFGGCDGCGKQNPQQEQQSQLEQQEKKLVDDLCKTGKLNEKQRKDLEEIIEKEKECSLKELDDKIVYLKNVKKNLDSSDLKVAQGALSTYNLFLVLMRVPAIQKIETAQEATDLLIALCENLKEQKKLKK